mgnify:CR=1 FL=1
MLPAALAIIIGLAVGGVAFGADDLAGRGFAAVEAYPEVGTRPDATSAADE